MDSSPSRRGQTPDGDQRTPQDIPSSPGQSAYGPDDQLRSEQANSQQAQQTPRANRESQNSVSTVQLEKEATVTEVSWSPVAITEASDSPMSPLPEENKHISSVRSMLPDLSEDFDSSFWKDSAGAPLTIDEARKIILDLRGRYVST